MVTIYTGQYISQYYYNSNAIAICSPSLSVMVTVVVEEGILTVRVGSLLAMANRKTWSPSTTRSFTMLMVTQAVDPETVVAATNVARSGSGKMKSSPSTGEVWSEIMMMLYRYSLDSMIIQCLPAVMLVAVSSTTISV